MVERQPGMLNDLKDGQVIQLDSLDDTLLLDQDQPQKEIIVEITEEKTEITEKPQETETVFDDSDQPPIIHLLPDLTPDVDETTVMSGEAMIKALDEALPEQCIVSCVTPDLDTEDWYSRLEPDELFNGPKGPGPRLCGLRRLAKPFILSEESRVNALIVVPRVDQRHPVMLRTLNSHGDIMSSNEEIIKHHFPMASVTFFITLRDGRTFSDSADAYFSNCNELGLFPTAVASARAEARTLRKVLSIKQHAAEEMTDKNAAEELTPNDASPIKPEQAKLIDKILKALEYSLKELLENITTREIFTVEELTTGEARKALRLLNDKKKSRKAKK